MSAVSQLSREIDRMNDQDMAFAIKIGKARDAGDFGRVAQLEEKQLGLRKKLAAHEDAYFDACDKQHGVEW